MSPGLTERSHEISELGTSPSTPPMSTNAPNGSTLVTVPMRVSPSKREARSVSRRAARSRSSSARRLTTIVRPSSAHSVTRNVAAVPTGDGAPSRGRCSATCEKGQNARAAPIFTS